MDREPIFNVPAVVLAVLGLCVAVHLGRGLLDPETDALWTLTLAVVPARLSSLATANELPGGVISAWLSMITHMFVHGSLTHLAFNGAWLLAFGTPLARRIGSARFLAFSGLCGVAGALTFVALHWGVMAALVGASGAISGMTAATLRFLFPAIRDRGLGALGGDPILAPTRSLSECLADRRFMIVAGTWLGLNAAIGLGFDPISSGQVIAWEAHIGGFLAGLLTYGWFDRVAADPGPRLD